VIFLVAAASGALVYPAITFRRTGGSTCLSPRNADSVHVLDDLPESGFGYGRVYPYAMLFVPRGGEEGSLLTHRENVTIAITNMTAAVKAMSNTPRYGINGLFYANDEVADTDTLELCLFACKDAPLNTSDPTCIACLPYLVAFKVYVTQSLNATWLRVVTASDPFDGNGTQWLRDVRRVATEVGDATGVDIHLAMGAGIGIDLADAIYASLPLAAGAMVATVFIILAASFRSLAIPIKAIITIAMTLSFVYGLSALVYQVL